MTARILLADDQSMFRHGLRAVLEREGFEVVGEAEDGRETVRLAQKLRPAVAVLDISMPALNGIDAARAIHKLDGEPIPIILLTMYEEDAYVLEALRAGIRGYVIKSQAAADLVAAVRDVLRVAVYLSPGICEVLVDACRTNGEPQAEPLTDREREVLQLIAEGNTTKAIARTLSLSVRTADSHRARIMQKLDLHTTADLVRYAIRRRIIQP